MPLQLTEAQIEYLIGAVSEDRERNREHLEWLQSPEAAGEEDKELQRRECERGLEQAEAILALLAV
jgi:hypothetical protein